MNQCMGNDVTSIKIFTSAGQIRGHHLRLSFSVDRDSQISDALLCPVCFHTGLIYLSALLSSPVHFVPFPTRIFLFQVRSLLLKSVRFISLPKTVILSLSRASTVCLTNHGLFLNQHPAAGKNFPLFHFQMSLQKLTMGTLMKKGIT